VVFRRSEQNLPAVGIPHIPNSGMCVRHTVKSPVPAKSPGTGHPLRLISTFCRLRRLNRVQNVEQSVPEDGVGNRIARKTAAALRAGQRKRCLSQLRRG
jgi:hypothetical protein